MKNPPQNFRSGLYLISESQEEIRLETVTQTDIKGISRGILFKIS